MKNLPSVVQIVVIRLISLLFILGLAVLMYVALRVLAPPPILGIALFDLEIVSIIFLLGSALLFFWVLRKLLSFLVDFILVHGVGGSHNLLLAVKNDMGSTFEQDDLVDQLIKLLLKHMRVQKAGFIFVEDHQIIGSRSKGFKKYALEDSKLKELFHRGRDTKRHFIFRKLKAASLKEIFQSLDIAFAAPITVADKEVAVLILGPKAIGKYSPDDIRVLDEFSQEAGLLIYKARQYYKIQLKNKELQRRLTHAAELHDAQGRELLQAQRRSRLKDEFVFVAAHELRTPVTAIKGFLELVTDGEATFPKDVQGHLDAIEEASEHLNRLVNDLLEVARSEAGTLNVIIRPMDIFPIIRSVIKETAPLAAEKEIAVIVQSYGTVPPILAEAGKVEEVAMNLISNAIKYNKKKGTIDISIFPAGDGVIVEFRDSGYGIPADRQKKIFQKFYRATTEGTERVLGTGLGLYISKMLIERMGGQMTFSSLEGHGSTFVFLLPTASDKPRVNKSTVKNPPVV